jgi:hypothetical protein
MTSHTPRRSRRQTRWLALLVACLAVLLAACTAAAPTVSLPAKTKAPVAKAAAASVQRPLSMRQQVIAAYTGYATAMAAAFDSRSPSQVRQLLVPYLSRATIRNAIQAFGKAWANDEVSYGHVERHIIGVRILGTAAWVHDCDNTSDSGLEYASTNQIVPGSLGITDDNLVTRLNLVHGHWVVWVQTIEDVSCTP